MLSSSPSVSTPVGVIEPPIVIDWTLPGPRSDSEPFKLLVIVIVACSKPEQIQDRIEVSAPEGVETVVVRCRADRSWWPAGSLRQAR